MPKITYVRKEFSEATLEIIERANALIDEYEPLDLVLTLRQLFYQFVARVWLPNTEREYKRLGRIVSDARRAGLIDWTAIVDRTRELRANSHWEGARDLLESAADSYAIDKWKDQESRVEVWVEKDALLGVVEPVCQRLDVPYFSCRGYVSDSEMWAAARRIYNTPSENQDIFILQLADHDPSGLDMTRDIEYRLGLFLGRRDGVWPNVERIALNMDQVERYELPPNPAKLSDSRSAGYRQEFGDSSWELDALDPRTLAELIEENVLKYRDEEKWKQACAEEEEERARLRGVHENWDEIAGGLDGKKPAPSKRSRKRRRR